MTLLTILRVFVNRIQAIRQQDPNLLKDVLDPALLDALAMLSEFVMDIKGQITAQAPRIMELRTKAKEDPCKHHRDDF